MPRLFIALALLAGCRSLPPLATPARACDGTIGDAAFLSGTWEHRKGPLRSDEVWSSANGTTMLGLGRTTEGARTKFFEFLRIEARPAGLVYVAQPGGGAPVEFPQSHCAPDELRFTNKAHDFPQQLSYRRSGDTLYVEIAGPGQDGAWTRDKTTLYRAR